MIGVDYNIVNLVFVNQLENRDWHLNPCLVGAMALYATYSLTKM